ncbi:MAG: zf-TFIIB domain-containing protein [Gemmatimonadota bacterium]|nr:MAG: zf-TFIIB domain-containing protein [Gemmatimonadota bacterium]
MTKDTSQLPCPSCKEPMRPEWHRAIEIDRCPACGDLWFDRTELTTYVADKTPGLGKVMLGQPRTVPGGPDTSLACPRCRVPSLEPYEWDGHRFSRCTSCSGVHLEGTTLDGIIADIEGRLQREKGSATPSEILFWLLFIAR